MPPQTEFIRFKVKQTFCFPAAEINAVVPDIKDSKLNQWQMDNWKW